MSHTVVDASFRPRLGPIVRTERPGPEADLVREYVSAFIPPPPRGQQRSVFIEPRIDSGYPDVVVAYWHVATMEKWSSSRLSLTPADVRIAHFLATHGATKEEHLLGYFGKRVSGSIDRLREAAVIHAWSGRLRLRSLQSVFAVRRLIAIEAKIRDWRTGLQQAALNTRFASESYLLLPALLTRVDVGSYARKRGVGLLIHGQPLDRSNDPELPRSIPRSYVSWLFNEWSWRVGTNY